MIGRLRGELIQKLPNLALVECAGVGYSAAISLSTYGLLPEAGSTVVLHTELLVRENEISDFPICNKSFNLSYCGFDL